MLHTYNRIFKSESFSHSVESDSATPWTVACQASLSMEFSRQEYWSGLPFPPPGSLPNAGIKPASPVALAAPKLAGGFFITELPGKPKRFNHKYSIAKIIAFSV